MTIPTTDKPAKPSTRRIKMLVRRALREKALGGKHFDRSREAIALARNAGFKEGTSLELEVPRRDGAGKELRRFTLINNFIGEKASRNVSIPHFEIVMEPKNPRSNGNGGVAAGVTPAAGSAS